MRQKRAAGTPGFLAGGLGLWGNLALVGVALAGLAVLLVAAVAATSDDDDGQAAVILDTPTAPPGTPTTSPAPATATPTKVVVDPSAPRGLAMPIAGACLPHGNDNLWPGAPRVYRNGTHEGIDFYPGTSCVEVARGTPVVASLDGTVVRADTTYLDLTTAENDEAQRIVRDPAASAADRERALDLYRGRQVWVDHGAGVVTRYAHLSAVAEGLRVGAKVRKGEIVGLVGNSGTPESLSSPGSEMHLHWELRLGPTYAGQGQPLPQVKALYESAFGP